jgi:hypothetical protein
MRESNTSTNLGLCSKTRPGHKAKTMKSVVFSCSCNMIFRKDSQKHELRKIFGNNSHKGDYLFPLRKLIY